MFLELWQLHSFSTLRALYSEALVGVKRTLLNFFHLGSVGSTSWAFLLSTALKAVGAGGVLAGATAEGFC